MRFHPLAGRSMGEKAGRHPSINPRPQQVGGHSFLPIQHGTFDLALHDWSQLIGQVQQQADELLAPIPGQTVTTCACQPPTVKELRTPSSGGLCPGSMVVMHW